MKAFATLFAAGALALAGVSGSGLGPVKAEEAKGCSPQGKVSYVCGPIDSEDLVAPPGERWIIGSSYRLGPKSRQDGPRLYAIDTKTQTARAAKVTVGKADPMYPGCAAPDLATLNSHGLELRVGKGAVHTLYVINHGGRESVEVFKADYRRGEPLLTWTGCVLMPADLNPNAVAALPNGAFAVTKFQDNSDKQAIAHILAGNITGGVFIWKPGKGFNEFTPGRLAGDNGMIASPDGKWIYVNAYGAHKVWRFALDGSAPPLSAAVEFLPDNLRWEPDGSIYATGQYITPQTLRGPHGWGVVRIDPKTMAVTPLIHEPGRPEFDDATVALQVGKTLWIGTFRGDRIAYVSAP